jgi:hypothetical protein
VYESCKIDKLTETILINEPITIKYFDLKPLIKKSKSISKELKHEFKIQLDGLSVNQLLRDNAKLQSLVYDNRVAHNLPLLSTIV